MLLCVNLPAWPVKKNWFLAIVWALSAATLTPVEAAQPAPTVTIVSPSSGPTAGGTSVTITGTHLNSATAVTFGGTSATTFTVINANSITATTPAHTVGAVNVAVTTPGGNNPANTLFTYVATLTLAATASATTQVGQSYSQSNVASGGTTPYTYSVSAGALPAGTTLNAATGTVAGTPTAAGAFSYTIKATDSSLPTAQTATQTVSGTIAPVTLTLAATASATTQVGQSYLQSNVASGGTTPYTYSVSAGALPAGTTLNAATGTVAGTPTAAGAFSYTIKATDSGLPTAQTATQTVSGTIGNMKTTTSIASSVNPSNVGQSVTFAATVATGGGTATGTITFKDGSKTLGTGTVSGNKTTFTTASLTLGVHSITAVYSGDSNYTASISAALRQSVAVPPDSLKLHAMQLAVTPLVAQISGQAIAGAIDHAIENGFSDNQQALLCNINGIIFNCGDELNGQPAAAASDGAKDFVAAPDRPASRIDNGFSALAYNSNNTKAPPRPTALQREWLGWIDVRGASVDQSSIGNDLRGNQVNALAGITHKFTPDFLIGVFGGYEYFNYTSDALTAHLKGNGWTVGSYLGWWFTPTLRADLGIARSGINFNDMAGTASGTFPGRRWLAAGGLTGTYPWQALVFQPSARIYALWEHEDEYIDTLGTIQNSRNFFTGRATGGTKVSYPFVWLGTTNVAPYAGIYGDYYFTSDDASTAGLAAIPLLQGWSVRFTSGLSLSFHGGSQLSLGGEVGGIGSNTTIWTMRAHASVPF